MNPADEIVARLEQLEASAAGAPKSYSEVLEQAESAAVLLEVAERLVPNSAIASALYSRGLALGVAEERLRGYRALASIFEGDLESASGLVLPLAAASRDDVLLSAWANLDEEPGEVTRRLVDALGRCPESIRLRRQLADYALRIRRMDLARSTHHWLLEHEQSETERDRVASVIRQYGW